MTKKTFFLVASGFFVGLALGASLTVYPQTRTTSLAGLAEEKKDITKMEWVLMNARVQALEWSLIQDFVRPVSPAGYEYDATKNRIVAAAFVNPTWLAKIDIEKTKQVLLGRGVDLCGLGAGGALMKQGSPFGLDWKSSCSVRFFTWTSGKAESISVKDVASFENGQLVLE